MMNKKYSMMLSFVKEHLTNMSFHVNLEFQVVVMIEQMMATNKEIFKK
jgi:hypothetical protein